MEAGKLSDMIEFQARSFVGEGESRTIVWTFAFYDRAEVTQSSETAATFAVRYRPNIGPETHRIAWDGKLWDITGAPHDRRRRQRTINCDFSMMVETTDLDSTEREYITANPVVRPRS